MTKRMTEKRRIKMVFEYLGGNYVGWQVQPNGISVQEVVEKALATIVNHSGRVTASGRTDAGVHAICQPAHADVETNAGDGEILHGMNALLPNDIVAREVVTVSDEWHARYSAKEKTYRYTIFNAPLRSAFNFGRVWHVKTPLDADAMREAARCFIGEHDFTSFRSAGCAAKHAVRQITRLEIVKEGDNLNVYITANGFLKQMVRNIVGTLVEVGRGKEPVAFVKEAMEAKDRKKAGPCAPPEGLCLVDVKYEN